LADLDALIVDDNFTNRRVLEGMLRRWGMRAAAVESGRTALQALHFAMSAGNPFPLVLLDGQMPEMDGFAVAELIKNDPTLSQPVIVMLTSAGQVGDAARCRALGIAGYLIKPLRQRELLECLCALMGTMPQNQRTPLVTKYSIKEDRNRRRALLVEDTKVNQKLVLRLLEKRGFEVTVADDGQAALVALERESFSLVLMDVHMPHLDGIAATTIIREREQWTGNHVPIIALSAVGYKSDQERCISAGMDAFVSKPIAAAELYRTIENCLNQQIEQPLCVPQH
jgi:CheY-like chemotaxis protein